MKTDAEWPSDIDANDLPDESEMSLVASHPSEIHRDHEHHLTASTPSDASFAAFQDPFWGPETDAPNGHNQNLPYVNVFDSHPFSAPPIMSDQSFPPWLHSGAYQQPHPYQLQPPMGMPPPSAGLPPPTWMVPFPPIQHAHMQQHPPPVFMPPPPRPRTSASSRGGINLGPRASVSSASAAAVSGESSSRTSSSASSPHPNAIAANKRDKEKEKERSSPTWSAEWLHEASSTPWYPLSSGAGPKSPIKSPALVSSPRPDPTIRDNHVPHSIYLATVLSPPRGPLAVIVDPYFGAPPRSEDQVQSAWQESYPALGPQLVPSFGRATYNRVRVRLGADGVHPETRLCVRLYILRSKQPSIGVADDFYWEALYECDYIAGWSSIPNEMSIVKPKKLRGEPTLSSAIFALRVSYSSPNDLAETNTSAWSSMFSLVRRSYETLRRRNAQQAAMGKRSPSPPISEPSLDFLEPMARPMPVPPPFGRSYSTPDHRLYTTSSTSSSTSSQQHGGRSARAPHSAGGRGTAGYGNRPASASVSASAPTAASTRRSLGELRLSVSPTIPTYASTPTLLSPPLPSGPMAVVSPWQIFSPSYAFAHLPPSEQDVVSHAATMASAAAAEQRQQQQQQQQHMSPYPYLAASTNTLQMQAHGQARSPALSQGSTFLPPPPISPQLARSPQLRSNPSMAEASVKDQDGDTS